MDRRGGPGDLDLLRAGRPQFQTWRDPGREPRWRFRLDRSDRRQPAGRDARRESDPCRVAGAAGTARRHHRIGGRPLRIQGLGDRRVQRQRRAEPADLAEVPGILRWSELA